MQTTGRKHRIVMTPGFQDAYGGPLVSSIISSQIAKLLGPANGNPSWVVGDPSIKANATEDDGRTLKIPTKGVKFYAIRDDHPDDCDCGCGGGAIVTFLLPEEY